MADMKFCSFVVLFGLSIFIYAGLCHRLLIPDTPSPFASIAPDEEASPSYYFNSPSYSTSIDSPCYNNPDYITNITLGSCYKVHTVGKTWRQAIAVCQEEGAHLATVTEKFNAYNGEWCHLHNISKNAFNGKPYYVFLGHWSLEKKWIGNEYMKVNDNGTLDSILEKYPPTICMKMLTSNGRLRLGKCSDTYPFICERELQEF